MKGLNCIRNIFIKSILMIGGLVMILAACYQELIYAFWLTERTPNGINWSLLFVGLFFATGAAFYNSVADSLSKAVSVIINKVVNTKK